MTNDGFSLRSDVSVHAWAMFDLRRRTIVSPGGVEFDTVGKCTRLAHAEGDLLVSDLRGYDSGRSFKSDRFACRGNDPVDEAGEAAVDLGLSDALFEDESSVVVDHLIRGQGDRGTR